MLSKNSSASSTRLGGQPVKGFRHKHGPWRDFNVLDALEEAPEFSGLRVVAPESGDAEVLKRFRQVQAMGFNEPHGGSVLSAFAVAPRLALG